MRRLGMLFAFCALWGSTLSAERLSTRDIIELSRAGLGDEVLLALIDVSRGVYPIDPATLKQLKDGGVSERVIAALVRSGREIVVSEPALSEEPPDEPRPQPQVIVVERPAPEIREVVVPVPVYLTAPGHIGRVRRAHVDTVPAPPGTRFVPFQQGPPLVLPTPEEPKQPKQPVYWGFGGKRRPDTWAEPPRNPDRK